MAVLFSGLENPAKASQGIGVLLNRYMVKAWKRRMNCVNTEGAGLCVSGCVSRTGSSLSFLAMLLHSSVRKRRRTCFTYNLIAAMMDKVHPRDELIILGDFNARVGVREDGIQIKWLFARQLVDTGSRS